MQKTNKSASSLGPQRPRRNVVPVPVVVSMDTMAAMPDEELINNLRSLEDDRQRLFATDQDATPWEVELAYIRRELQIRRERRVAHERYSKFLEREYVESESNLPVADLDNSYFLRLVGEMS